MSYVINKFNNGNVKIQANVCGWYFEESKEFRPLMADVMQELLDAGLITQKHVDATKIAEAVHTEKMLMEYAKNEKEFWDNPANEEAQNERLFEMKAAFGSGETVVNALTGMRFKT